MFWTVELWPETRGDQAAAAAWGQQQIRAGVPVAAGGLGGQGGVDAHGAAQRVDGISAVFSDSVVVGRLVNVSCPQDL